jgi:hypothetical protein
MESAGDAAMVQQSMLGMGTIKSLTIQIDDEDLQMLRANGYSLCLAKQCAGMDAPYTVVWDSESQYLMENTLSWAPEYQLFGCNMFEPNVTVQVSTNETQIGLGETSTLDQYGIVSEPQTGGPVSGITMVNHYGPINPGLNQLLTTIAGNQISMPFYVCDQPVVMGSTTLTPSDVVLVWFQQNIQTSTMLGGTPGNSIQIDLTGRDSATATYQQGQWSAS